MLPDLTVLIAILLGLGSLVEGPVDVAISLAGTAASICVAAGLTWQAGERGLRAVETKQAELALLSVRWAGIYPLLGWIACLQFFNWGSLVVEAVPRVAWLGRYAVLFLPAALTFAVGWAQHGRIQEAVARARGTAVLPAGPRAAIRQAVRRNAIALFPMMVILGLLDGLWVLGEFGVPGMRLAARWLEAMPMLTLGVMLGLLAVLTLLLPAIFRLLFATESLPPGRARDVLERHAAHLRVRYRDIVVWKTKGRVLNAMVVGFTARTRLIFLTDGLLRHLPEEEVLAVFSHEAGHAKRQHLPLLLMLFVATALLFQIAGDYLLAIGVPDLLVIGLHLAFLWYVLLGAISRFFEREADVYGAEHAAALVPDAPSVPWPGAPTPLPAGASWMVRALQRIEQITGRGASHRHGTIQDRVAYVSAYATDPDVRRGFARTRRRLLVGAAVSILVAVGLAAWRLPADIRLARAWIRIEDGQDAYARALRARQNGDAASAQAAWAETHRAFRETADDLEALGDWRGIGPQLTASFNAADTSLHGLGDEDRALREFDATLELARENDIGPSEAGGLLFQAHVDLGRIRAHRGEAEAFDHWRAVRTAAPPAPRVGAGYLEARRQLLRAVLRARYAGDPRDHKAEAPPGPATAADRALARQWLEDLASRRGREPEWVELRVDATIELELLDALERNSAD